MNKPTPRHVKIGEGKDGGMSLRNKIIAIVVSLVVLALIGVVLFAVQGGELDILADQLNYASQDPGQAANNIIQHGQVKGETGQICGVIRGMNGELVAGAKVAVSGGRIDWSTQTDKAGKYCIPPLDYSAIKVLGEPLVGNFTISVSSDKYYPQSKKVKVKSSEEKTLNFQLSSKTQEMLPSIY